jgi:hypothetical protein
MEEPGASSKSCTKLLGPSIEKALEQAQRMRRQYLHLSGQASTEEAPDASGATRLVCNCGLCGMR